MAANGVSAASCHLLSSSLLSEIRKQSIATSSSSRVFGYVAKNVFGECAVAFISIFGRSWGSVLSKDASNLWPAYGCWPGLIAQAGHRKCAINCLLQQVPPRPASLRMGAVASPGCACAPALSLSVRAGDGEVDTATSKGAISVVEAESTLVSEADKIVDNMSFAQLCNEFECSSSPAVEQTARLVAKELLGGKESSRVLGVYAVSVKYKDPLRSFVGRELYKRPSWQDMALENATVTINQMVMQSTSVLKICWTLRGKPRLIPVGVDNLVLKVTSTYTLNQISGQITEHEEEWDLSSSSLPAQIYFWSSRLAYATVQAGKDSVVVVDGVKKKLFERTEDSDSAFYYQDPSGDPRKFFFEDNFQKDVYQIGLLIALIYLAVQFLRLTL